jgi:hypothetical protein
VRNQISHPYRATDDMITASKSPYKGHKYLAAPPCSLPQTSPLLPSLPQNVG